MSFKFSQRSKDRLVTCDPRLQDIFTEVIRHTDCTIVSGWRGEIEQNELKRTGKSQIGWPLSKHNHVMVVSDIEATPDSLAIDAMPYPVNWKDRERATLFAGFVQGMAVSLGHKIRWGGDWDQDWDVIDNSFDDLAHFELVV
jgi:peptidoglycan L-alanyl-D-glutamate endopeptidase CwlK